MSSASATVGRMQGHLSGRRPLITLMLGLVVVVVGLVGCSGESADDGPRQLTSDEAQRFAGFRVKNFRAEALDFEATIIDGDVTVFAQGTVDSRDHEAVAVMTPRGATEVSRFLARWTVDSVDAMAYAGDAVPTPLPEEGWESSELDSSASALAAAQVLVVSLSNDRADNPQLLTQSGARWLRREELGGVEVDVMGGPTEGDQPSSLRYTIDDDGQLHRLEARLDGEHWSTFNFDVD